MSMDSIKQFIEEVVQIETETWQQTLPLQIT